MNARSHPTLPSFGWVLDGELAGLAFPNPDTWHELTMEGVGAVVTLTGEVPLGTRPPQLRWRHHPIEDFDAPDAAALEQTLAWMRARVEEGHPVAVHCHAGLGRTGTVLAAYLGRFHERTAAQAIEEVRRLRPFSLGAANQRVFVERFLANPAPDR